MMRRRRHCGLVAPGALGVPLIPAVSSHTTTQLHHDSYKGNVATPCHHLHCQVRHFGGAKHAFGGAKTSNRLRSRQRQLDAKQQQQQQKLNQVTERTYSGHIGGETVESPPTTKKEATFSKQELRKMRAHAAGTIWVKGHDGEEDGGMVSTPSFVDQVLQRKKVSQRQATVRTMGEEKEEPMRRASTESKDVSADAANGRFTDIASSLRPKPPPPPGTAPTNLTAASIEWLRLTAAASSHTSVLEGMTALVSIHRRLEYTFHRPPLPEGITESALLALWNKALLNACRVGTMSNVNDGNSSDVVVGMSSDEFLNKAASMPLHRLGQVTAMDTANRTGTHQPGATTASHSSAADHHRMLLAPLLELFIGFKLKRPDLLHGATSTSGDSSSSTSRQPSSLDTTTTTTLSAAEEERLYVEMFQAVLKAVPAIDCIRLVGTALLGMPPASMSSDKTSASQQSKKERKQHAMFVWCESVIQQLSTVGNSNHEATSGSARKNPALVVSDALSNLMAINRKAKNGSTTKHHGDDNAAELLPVTVRSAILLDPTVVGLIAARAYELKLRPGAGDRVAAGSDSVGGSSSRYSGAFSVLQGAMAMHTPSQTKEGAAAKAPSTSPITANSALFEPLCKECSMRGDVETITRLVFAMYQHGLDTEPVLVSVIEASLQQQRMMVTTAASSTMDELLGDQQTTSTLLHEEEDILAALKDTTRLFFQLRPSASPAAQCAMATKLLHHCALKTETLLSSASATTTAVADYLREVPTRIIASLIEDSVQPTVECYHALMQCYCTRSHSIGGGGVTSKKKLPATACTSSTNTTVFRPLKLLEIYKISRKAAARRKSSIQQQTPSASRLEIEMLEMALAACAVLRQNDKAEELLNEFRGIRTEVDNSGRFGGGVAMGQEGYHHKEAANIKLTPTLAAAMSPPKALQHAPRYAQQGAAKFLGSRYGAGAARQKFMASQLHMNTTKKKKSSLRREGDATATMDDDELKKTFGQRMKEALASVRSSREEEEELGGVSASATSASAALSHPQLAEKADALLVQQQTDHPRRSSSSSSSSASVANRIGGQAYRFPSLRCASLRLLSEVMALSTPSATRKYWPSSTMQDGDKQQPSHEALLARVNDHVLLPLFNTKKDKSGATSNASDFLVSKIGLPQNSQSQLTEAFQNAELCADLILSICDLVKARANSIDGDDTVAGAMSSETVGMLLPEKSIDGFAATMRHILVHHCFSKMVWNEKKSSSTNSLEHFVETQQLLPRSTLLALSRAIVEALQSQVSGGRNIGATGDGALPLLAPPPSPAVAMLSRDALGLSMGYFGRGGVSASTIVDDGSDAASFSGEHLLQQIDAHIAGVAHRHQEQTQAAQWSSSSSTVVVAPSVIHKAYVDVLPSFVGSKKHNQNAQQGASQRAVTPKTFAEVLRDRFATFTEEWQQEERARRRNNASEAATDAQPPHQPVTFLLPYSSLSGRGLKNSSGLIPTQFVDSVVLPAVRILLDEQHQHLQPQKKGGVAAPGSSEDGEANEDAVFGNAMYLKLVLPSVAIVSRVDLSNAKKHPHQQSPTAALRIPTLTWDECQQVTHAVTVKSQQQAREEEEVTSHATPATLPVWYADEDVPHHHKQHSSSSSAAPPMTLSLVSVAQLRNGRVKHALQQGSLGRVGTPTRKPSVSSAQTAPRENGDSVNESPAATTTSGDSTSPRVGSGRRVVPQRLPDHQRKQQPSSRATASHGTTSTSPGPAGVTQRGSSSSLSYQELKKQRGQQGKNDTAEKNRTASTASMLFGGKPPSSKR